MSTAIETILRIYATHEAGCCWHLVLDDGNTDDLAVETCAATADRERHADCLALVSPMRAASPAERDAVVRQVQEYEGSR